MKKSMFSLVLNGSPKYFIISITDNWDYPSQIPNLLNNFTYKPSACF